MCTITPRQLLTQMLMIEIVRREQKRERATYWLTKTNAIEVVAVVVYHPATVDIAITTTMLELYNLGVEVQRPRVNELIVGPKKVRFLRWPHPRESQVSKEAFKEKLLGYHRVERY